MAMMTPNSSRWSNYQEPIDEEDEREGLPRMFRKMNVPDVASAATREESLSAGALKDRRREIGVGILEFSPEKAGRDITPLKMNISQKCISGTLGALAGIGRRSGTFSCSKGGVAEEYYQEESSDTEEVTPLTKTRKGYQQISDLSDSEGPSIMKRKYHHYTLLESDSSQTGPPTIGRPSSKLFMSSAPETETTSLTNVSMSSSAKAYDSEDVVAGRPWVADVIVEDVSEFVTSPNIERRFDDFTERMHTFENKMRSNLAEIFELVAQQQLQLTSYQQQLLNKNKPACVSIDSTL
ncbi:uncharacterized protein LOC144436375 [Glandiceps talaboti]